MELRLFLMCFALCVASISGTATEDNRDEPPSRREHNDAENLDYDHKAFLGQEEAKTFDQLIPEESKERLGMLVDHIDEDKDGFVTMEEMKEWLTEVQRRWIYKNIDRQWEMLDINGDDLVSWEEYRDITYGNIDAKNEDGLSYSETMGRDERRFKIADQDGDQNANKKEFASFIHPEHFEHMEDIMVHEMMEDMDKNGDGVIDVGEYSGNTYRHVGKPKPQWVKMDRERFTELQDKNKDGKMDKEEMQDWISTTEYNQARAEAEHLILEADADKDGRLTKAEILDKYDVFVGSLATDFGEVLTQHDEL
ncbi:calumenin-B-like [Hippocampus comes]|uniref:Reticulocalbin-3 n=1 Tax=Hippocampus comes TaxID=109280 RepID=A0A3Q2XJU1_HIPCM|nr:PREDICTED: calumenin-B-like [Hippocampus comes]